MTPAAPHLSEADAGRRSALRFADVISLLRESFEVLHVLLRLLAEGAAHQGPHQPHQQTAEPVFALARPERRLRTGFGQPVAHRAPHALADDLSVEVDDLLLRDPAQV